jgi:hypothetical protein
MGLKCGSKSILEVILTRNNIIDKSGAIDRKQEGTTLFVYLCMLE